MKKISLEIGKSIPRFDAFAKVTGKEKYASDFWSPDMLWAGVKRAGVPHARIRGIKTDEAISIPGVLSVLTSRDVKGTNRQGVVRKDQPVLADDRVRHCGDPVALVVAKDRETLAMALSAIELDLEPLQAVFDPEKALEQGAPLVHERNLERNLLLKGSLETGKGEAAFEECDETVEAEFRLPHQEHAYLETEAGWAILRDGVLEITASTQSPFRDRYEMAEAIGFDMHRVRIIAPYCGGAFGGKDGITVQSLLGLAALNNPGRPVKMWWSREESILASAKRHPARLYYKLGAKKDGAFHALSARVYFDTGPYDHLGGAVMALGLEHSGGPYRIPNANLKAWSVFTNNPIGGPFRGFGVTQANAAMEQMVDLMAKRVGISPLDIRLKNALRRGDRNPAGVTLTGSTGIGECLKKIPASRLWQERETWKKAAPLYKKRGAGLASAMQGMGYGPLIPDTANAKIELNRDGRFRVFCGVVDMGQGNASTYLQIAGEILNQDMSGVELVLPDTARTLPSGSSSASRTTFTYGNALIKASKILKQRLLEKAADLLMAKGSEEMDIVPGCVRHMPSGKEMPLSALAGILSEAERTSVARYRTPSAKESPASDPLLTLHGIPHIIFSYAAHAAFVEIDTLTGRIEVKCYLAITDCGRILNPQAFEQQIHGGIAQGLGYALCEELKVDHGMILTPDLGTYIIPTSMDLPDMESSAVELHEENGPFGLKGAGEIAVNGPYPAVANAIADACGIRILEGPMTAERVLGALNALQRGEAQ
ncbi:MAG: xanthine dehydrogenase family protein molybdopterin-binding subunit [Desulfobacteraceae bacterium]|nr:MAG: xanthine dehydrogenase family protein molybdopterin-binding subunit [Desulfobacteraceae bacterium]